MANEFKYIKIYEYKKVGRFILAKVTYPVWLDHGKRLGESFPRTLIFLPKDQDKEIEISDFLEYDNVPEEYRDDERAKFGGHQISNLRNWNDSGDAPSCSNYEQFKTSEDIERYLKKHPYGWW